ncbi:MAG: putative prokaryotic signal transducing protein [Gaiellaceae bacterium]|nr:putative prokaryotic signal transducing protein [Gaiellaceae bacterium]
MADAVYLTLVPSEVEAELLCALLRTDGIECEQRPTNFSVGMMDGMPGGGPREVFVGEQDLARAREILAASRSD